MYLTAQKVAAAGTQREGINAFLWRHVHSAPSIDWKAPDVVRIAEEYPGTLAASRIELPPGGNVVRAYLDIAAAEGVEEGAIDRALQTFGEQLSLASLGRPALSGGVAVRFGTSLGLEGELAEEFAALRESAIKLLRNRAATEQGQHQAPLRVLVTPGLDARTFELDPPSVERIRGFHAASGREWVRARISVAVDVEASVRAVWGDLGQHLAPVLTGVALDGLGALGGIQFTEAGTNKVLWEWPLPSGGPGYCLGCHQHGTLRRAGTGFVCAFCENQQDTDGLWVAALQ